MSPKEAAEATTFSRTMLTLLAEAGTFPRPVQLGERRIAFVRAEVEAWIDSRISARAAA
ncbi:transcriptional regulator [Ensifer sp. MMN_5]|nr:transcriptional regulator [Ensifer sp. MMN_5]